MASSEPPNSERKLTSVPAVFGLNQIEMVEMNVPNDLRSVKEPEDYIIRELQRLNYHSDVIFAIKLALEEALTNAVKHGNRLDSGKRVTVSAHVSPHRCLCMIRDEGRGFTPEAVPDCTAEENLERPSGRGIMLMNAYMTKVFFNKDGNEVWLLRENPTGCACGTSENG